LLGWVLAWRRVGGFTPPGRARRLTMRFRQGPKNGRAANRPPLSEANRHPLAEKPSPPGLGREASDARRHAPAAEVATDQWERCRAAFSHWSFYLPSGQRRGGFRDTPSNGWSPRT